MSKKPTINISKVTTKRKAYKETINEIS